MFITMVEAYLIAVALQSQQRRGSIDAGILGSRMKKASVRALNSEAEAVWFRAGDQHLIAYALRAYAKTVGERLAEKAEDLADRIDEASVAGKFARVDGREFYVARSRPKLHTYVVSK